MTKEEKSEYNKCWREKNKEYLKEYLKEYRENNNKKLNAINKASYEKNKEYFREYHRNHKEHRNKRLRDRRKINALYKMSENLRRRITSIFKNIRVDKPAKTEKLLGTNFLTVKKHIEQQFKENMTWQNYGHKTWHIDHIIPLASANDMDELIALFHYTNLQPLWAKENMSKGAKLNYEATK